MILSDNLTFEKILNDSSLDEKLKNITSKVKDNQRINEEEGIYLYEKAPLSYLAVLANYIREKKNGNFTYFNKNFHVEPTNLCVYTCTFCSYSRLIKQRHEGWELTIEDILEIVKKYDNQPVTEVHIVGGVLPGLDLKYYTTLFKAIKEHRPELHIKALTPVEYHYIFKKAKVSYEEGMQLMADAGLDSMPGGGAEIFDEAIRKEIAGGKCSSDEWLKIHEIWHKMGKKSNATILYGHIENYAHRIDHLSRLRALQDETGGFQTFIPLKFRNQNNQLSHLDEVSIIEDLRNYAVSRIYLDNFDHIKAYWPMIGRQIAQIALSCGVDDIDGTIDDTTKIYSMAGAEEQNPSMTTDELIKLIKAVGRQPIERNTLYEVLNDYSDYNTEDSEFKGYISLPVVN